MIKILHIDASARPGLAGIDPHGSVTRRLTADFVNKWLQKDSNVEIKYRDVGLKPPSFVNHAWIEAAFSENPDSEEFKLPLNESNELIDELDWADLLILGVPMYNFGIPANFKAWIDNIVRVGKTVIYDSEDKVHPYKPAYSQKNLPVVLFSSRGDYGMDEGGPYAYMNYLEPGVKTAFKFIGITDIYNAAVEHQTGNKDLYELSLQTTLSNNSLIIQEIRKKHFSL